MAKKKKETEKDALADIEALASSSSLPDWERVGLMHAMDWAPGKQITEAAFNDALEKFRNRPQGGGRIV